MASLEDILSDKEEKIEKVEKTEVAEKVEQKEASTETAESGKQAEVISETKEAKEQRLRDEKGKFVAKQDKKEEVKEEKTEAKSETKSEPKNEMSERERAFLAAAHDERVKRQALEKRLQELQSAPTANQPPQSFWDDPEASLKKFQDEMQGVVVNTKLNTAETIARSKYKDFDDQVQVFAQLLQQTPGLYQQWLNSPDPAEYAYNTGKKHREISQLGNLDSWKANTEKEIRIRLESEMKEKMAEFEKTKNSLPGSLSDARSVSHNQPVFSGPTSLENILKP